MRRVLCAAAWAAVATGYEETGGFPHEVLGLCVIVASVLLVFFLFREPS